MSLRTRVTILVGGLAGAAVLLLVFRPTYEMRVAFDAEFHTRPDGYRGLCRHYGFEFPEEPRQMEPGLMYRVLADGAVDVIDAFATDGRIEAYDLLVLEDDRGYFPPYYAAPLVRQHTLRRHPELKPILERLAGKLPDETMRRLNYQVDGEGRKAADVAREFLVAEGLLAAGAQPSDGRAGSIAVGGKQFTEQEVLGVMMAALIECETQLEVVRRLNLGGTMICFQALRAGDLDLYAEYTGTGLVNVLNRRVISDPDESFRVVQRVFEQKYDLVWLAPFGFNNTYALAMRRAQAEELGVTTISDLADYFRTPGSSRESVPSSPPARPQRTDSNGKPTSGVPLLAGRTRSGGRGRCPACRSRQSRRCPASRAVVQVERCQALPQAAAHAPGPFAYSWTGSNRSTPPSPSTPLTRAGEGGVLGRLSSQDRENAP